jgi:hypothetical protein
MKMVKRYKIVRTQSSNGEIHLILSELKLNNTSNNRSVLDETQIREIMKKEAQKPLLPDLHFHTYIKI